MLMKNCVGELFMLPEPHKTCLSKTSFGLRLRYHAEKIEFRLFVATH